MGFFDHMLEQSVAVLAYVLCSTILFQQSLVKNRNKMYVAMTLLLLSINIRMNIQGRGAWIPVFLIHAMVVYCLLDTTVVRSACVYIASYVIYQIISIPVLWGFAKVLAYFSINTMSASLCHGAAGSAICIVVCGVMTLIHYFVPPRNKELLLLWRLRLLSYISIVAAFCICYLDVWVNGNIGVEFQNISAIIIVILTVVLAAMLLNILNLNSRTRYYQTQSKMQERLLVEQEEKYKAVQESYMDLHKIRHDMKAHIFTMKSLIKRESYEELKEYVEDMMGTSYMAEDQFSTGKDIVNAWLSHMQSEAQKKDIRIVCEGKFMPNLGLRDYELCTIFSNLLTNAIEAIERIDEAALTYREKVPATAAEAIQEGMTQEEQIIAVLRQQFYQPPTLNLPAEKRVISIGITTRGGNLILTVRNPVVRPVDLLGIKAHLSTKKDGFRHGFGLRNVEEIAQRHLGYVSYQNLEDNHFEISVLFMDAYQELK